MAAAKGRRRNNSTFGLLPSNVFQSPACTSLTHAQWRVLTCLALEYRGRNNGDLSAALKVMARYGVRSQSVITASIRVLIERGLIERTRVGDRRRPHLYAVTWAAIDGHDKYDEGYRSGTRVASNAWKAWHRDSKPKLTVVPGVRSAVTRN